MHLGFVRPDLVVAEARIDQDVYVAKPDQPAMNRHRNAATFVIVVCRTQPVLVRLESLPVEIGKEALGRLPKQMAVKDPRNFNVPDSTYSFHRLAVLPLPGTEPNEKPSKPRIWQKVTLRCIVGTSGAMQRATIGVNPSRSWDLCDEITGTMQLRNPLDFLQARPERKSLNATALPQIMMYTSKYGQRVLSSNRASRQPVAIHFQTCSLPRRSIKL